MTLLKYFILFSRQKQLNDSKLSLEIQKQIVNWPKMTNHHLDSPKLLETEITRFGRTKTACRHVRIAGNAARLEVTVNGVALDKRVAGEPGKHVF